MKTVGELIERNAAYYPDRDAFVLDPRRLSYRQYAQRSRQLASALYGLGLRRQDRVGILSTNSLEYFEAYGACEWAGYILALYNFRSAAPEIAHVIGDSAPRVVLFEAAFAPLVDGIRAQFPEVRWVCIDASVPAQTPEWAQPYAALIESGDEQGPPIRAQPEDIAYLFYTSGTTGKPKGVPWSHATALTAGQREGRAMGSGIRLLQISPAFHVGGKGFPLGAMYLGGATVLERSFDAGRFLELIARERITNSFMVPMMMQAVMDHPDFGKHDLSSLRGVMSASTAIPVPLLKRAIEKFGPVFYVAYGSTETGNIAALETFELKPDGTPEDIRRLGSVGHFKPEVECTLLDEEGQVCAPGVVGEVCVKGYVFQGYWNNSIATIEATRTGWFHTGDLGYLDDEGYLFLVDRKKDMIISGGENIYSREVEEALFRHPAVQNVAVVGVADPKWGEVVKAIVVLKSGRQASEAELIAHCQKEIARYKCPRSIDYVAELPLLGTGKIDKVALRKRYR